MSRGRDLSRVNLDALFAACVSMQRCGGHVLSLHRLVCSTCDAIALISHDGSNCIAAVPVGFLFGPRVLTVAGHGAGG